MDERLKKRLNQAAILHQQALDLEQQGRFQEAERYYRQALAILPDEAIIHYNLANALQAQGKVSEAFYHYRQTLAIDPNFAAAYNNLGNLYQHQGDLEQSIQNYQQAIALAPDYFLAHNNLGAVYQQQGNLSKAQHCYREALKLQPRYSEVLLNLGATWVLAGDLVQAESCFEQVMVQELKSADAHVGLGNVCRARGDMINAHQWYQAALQIEPDLPQAHYNLGLLLLLQGKLKEGFKKFEWRWYCSQHKTLPSLDAPRWDGSALNGKSILLYAEQGYGDAIQFIRYVPLVIDLGGRVTVVCQPALVSLFKTLKNIERVIPVGEEKQYSFDICDFLMSLPYRMGTTLETVPKVEEFQGLSSLNSPTPKTPKTLKVGITWASGYRDDPEFLNLYHQKSCPFEVFRKILTVPNCAFYSFQMGHHRADLPQNEPDFCIDLSSQLRDFADTASHLNQMDLVITVDTAVAHLAGSLGIPVWVLLSHPPDWRWMCDRDDSPWYPSMRLFRQTKAGDWESVIQNVCHQLMEYASL